MPLVCGDEWDSARGSLWHCPPHIRSIMGATALPAWGIQDPLLAGGFPELEGGGGRKDRPTAYTCKEWGGVGAELVPPTPFCLLAAPLKPIRGPTTACGVWDGAQRGCCQSPALGMGSRMVPRDHPLTPRRAAGQAACCTPGLCQPPAPLPRPCRLPLGWHPRAGAWHGAEGLAGGRAASRLPPSSRGVKNSALVMNI